jgi:hypothetical protein
VHQRLDPEGRPDRRLSTAVECMVAITNFGATGGGAGKFQHGRLRFGPKNWEKRRGVRPARRPWRCEVAVEHLPKGIADRGDIAPDGRTAQPPKRSPEFKGIVAGAMEMPQVRLIFCPAVPSPATRIGGSRATGTSRAQRHQILELGAEDIPENTRPGRRRDGRPLTIFAF